MKKRTFALSILAALTLVACDSKVEPLKAAPAVPGALIDKNNPATLISNIVSSVKGFSFGNSAAPQTVVIFFDAQCPHCKHLWQAVQPLQGSKEVKFLWVPVGLLNRASYTQGAALLSAPNPVEAMKLHEESLDQEHGKMGMAAGELTDAGKALIDTNTNVLRTLFTENNNGVPFVVAKDQKTGEVWMAAGSMSTATLAAKLGLSDALK